MSTGDDETVTFNIGEWVAPVAGDPEPVASPARRDRSVVLPAAVAVAALLIVFTVVGTTMSHKNPGSDQTWMTTPQTQSPAPPSPGVTLLSDPVSASASVRRSSLAATTRPTSKATTRPAGATTTPTTKAPTSATPTTPSPSPSCSVPNWPYGGCHHHHK